MRAWVVLLTVVAVFAENEIAPAHSLRWRFEGRNRLGMGVELKRYAIGILILDAILCVPAAAQVITTVAGTAFSFPDKVAALNAPLGNTTGLAVDPQGNIYVADNTNDV